MKKAAKGKKKVSQQQSTCLYIEEVDEKTLGVGLFSDTVCTRDFGHSSWEAIYQYFEEEEPRVTTRTIKTYDQTFVYEAIAKDAFNSFLHKIGPRPRLLPFTYMV